MRVIGIDLGERRIGLAVSDQTATLARPLRTMERDRSDEAAAGAVIAAVEALHAEEEVGCLVFGLPTRLDGTPSDQTARVRKMVALISSRTAIPIAWQDERLSSHEADERLATHERDWRKRKAKLDAAAAAVILQDYLDSQRRERV
jgi:putative holliday junction resolvase